MRTKIQNVEGNEVWSRTEVWKLS